MLLKIIFFNMTEKILFNFGKLKINTSRVIFVKEKEQIRWYWDHILKTIFLYLLEFFSQKTTCLEQNDFILIYSVKKKILDFFFKKKNFLKKNPGIFPEILNETFSISVPLFRTKKRNLFSIKIHKGKKDLDVGNPQI